LTLPGLWRAYAGTFAFDLYAAFAVIALGAAFDTALRWPAFMRPVLALIVAYPLIWYVLHRFVVQARWLDKKQRHTV